MLNLTISIISYNTADLLVRNIASILKHTKGLKYEIIVVDNASSDNSVNLVKNRFPKVKLIQNRANKFYAHANNQALELASGRYFLILNSDMYINSNAFKKMVAYLGKHPEIGAIEPMQLSEKGQIIATGSHHTTLLVDLVQLTLLHKLFAKLPYFKRIKMTTKNRKHTWPAEVVCGGALMIKTELFRQIGGYDERYNLYYVENDLCRELQRLNLQTVHYAGARFYHTVSASTDKLGWKKVNNLYAKDGYNYYHKHHWFFPAIIFFLSLKFSSSIINFKKNYRQYTAVSMIVVIASFLRFWRLDELMPFIGDQGRDYLAARDALSTGQIPLLGIASSVPRFHQGPLYVWFTAAALKLGNFNPVYPALMAASLGFATVGLLFYLAEKHFGTKTAFFATLILAASPLAVAHSRLAFHTNAIPLFSLIYLAVLLAYLQKPFTLLYPALAFALLFQFELVTAPLILFIPAVVFVKRIKLTPKSFSAALLGLLLGLLPEVIYDLTHRFVQLGIFVIWIGYRLASFAGLYQEHAASTAKISQTLATIVVYLQKFIAWGSFPITAATLILTGVCLLNLRRRLSTRTKLLLAWIGLILTSFIILGNASEAYFPVLFVPFALLLGHLLSVSTTTKTSALAAGLLLISLALYNAGFFISQNFLTAPVLAGNPFGSYGSPLKEQLAVTDLIGSKVTGSINLKTLGEGSQFASILDNYYYLLWYRFGLTGSDTAPVIWIYPNSTAITPLNTTGYRFATTTVALPQN